jgi:hypothetical protein
MALVVATWAWAKPFTAHINLYETAKIGDVTLEPGLYEVKVENGKVIWMKGKKVVTEVKGEWTDTKEKPRRTSVIVDEGLVKEVRFEGKSQVLMIR